MNTTTIQSPSEWATAIGNTARHVQPYYTRAGHALKLLAATLDTIDPGDPDLPVRESVLYCTVAGTIEVAEMVQISLTNPEARAEAGARCVTNYRFGVDTHRRALIAIPCTKKLGDTGAFQIDLTKKNLDRVDSKERVKLGLISQELERILTLWWLPPKR